MTRTLLLALLTLAIAVIATTLTAWALAVWSPLTSRQVEPADRSDWPPRLSAEQVDAELRQFPLAAPLSQAPAYVQRISVVENHFCKIMMIHLGYLAPGSMTGWRADVETVGFPLPCLAAVTDEVATFGATGVTLTPGPAPWKYGLDLPRWAATHEWFRRIPLMPLWPGFVMNTLCFAAALMLVRVGLRAAITRHRRRRQRCATCGYPLAALSTCPECGRSVGRTV